MVITTTIRAVLFPGLQAGVVCRAYTPGMPRRPTVARDSSNRLLSTGECWCGCGEGTTQGKFFVSGHDRRAEAAVIKAEYGDVAEFIVAHGYGPGRKKL